MGGGVKEWGRSLKKRKAGLAILKSGERGDPPTLCFGAAGDDEHENEMGVSDTKGQKRTERDNIFSPFPSRLTLIKTG
jgi:hypothetical protein